MSTRATAAGGDEARGRVSVRRIAFAAPSWPPDQTANGIVSHIANMRQALRAGGMQVHVVIVRGGDGAKSDESQQVWASDVGATAPTFATRAAWTMRRPFPAWSEAAHARGVGARVARAVERLRLRHGLQLVEAEESFGWAYEVVRRCDVPVVVRLHGPWFLAGAFQGDARGPASLRRIRREHRAIAAAAGVSAPSMDVLDRVRRFYGLPLPDARVIPMPMTAPPDSARWRLDACDRNRILFVGRFDTLKGGDVLIEAFRRVLEHRPSTRLTLAGPDHGVEADPARGKQSLREFVQERLSGALDDGRIEFTGRVTPAELDVRRRGAFATVVLSRYETFGNVLREAMILGCPVVSTDVGGLGEILEDGVNALVVPAGNAEATAAALLRLLDAPGEAVALGTRAFEDCSGRYHPDRIVAQSAEFYNDVIARHASARR